MRPAVGRDLQLMASALSALALLVRAYAGVRSGRGDYTRRQIPWRIHRRSSSKVC